MATEVIVPKVDMVMESATFVEWLTQEGGHVHKGDPLFVITTDKAAIEVESPADGVLAGVTAKADDILPVTQVIGYILVPGESLPAGSGGKAPAVSIPQFATEELAAPERTAIRPTEPGNVRATPVARRMARTQNIDLAQISGRGPLGRIQKADILAFLNTQETQPRAAFVEAFPPVAATPEVLSAPSSYISRTASAASAPAAISAPIPLPDARRKQVVPLSGPRKIISQRMVYSAFSAPHINLSLRVDMTELIRLRERVLEPLQALTGHKVSYTAILARAVATVLPQHPYLNASLCDDQIILWEDIHLGIATSVDENLIVPVIREAQKCNLGQLVTALADLTERARGRRLKPAEMTGSTFTISNLGMYGIESFTAIINPPEAAILAVGKIVDMPVNQGGQIVLRPSIELTACADHRIVDGAAVAHFLADLKNIMENPYLLI